MQDNLLDAYIRFEDTQDIQFLQDECYRISHFLDVDRTILQKLMTVGHVNVRNKADVQESSLEYLQDLITELEFEQKRIDNILRRLGATIALVRKHCHKL